MLNIQLTGIDWPLCNCKRHQIIEMKWELSVIRSIWFVRIVSLFSSSIYFCTETVNDCFNCSTARSFWRSKQYSRMSNYVELQVHWIVARFLIGNRDAWQFHKLKLTNQPFHQSRMRFFPSFMSFNEFNPHLQDVQMLIVCVQVILLNIKSFWRRLKSFCDLCHDLLQCFQYCYYVTECDT